MAEDPEKRRARNVAYHAAHRDEINARKRAKAAENREQERARHAAYRASNPEKVRSQWAAYRESHLEELLVRNATYHRERVIRLAGEVIVIGHLPENLQPVARLIKETRREIRNRRHTA